MPRTRPDFSEVEEQTCAVAAEEVPLSEILPAFIIERVQQAVGQASMCWERPCGAGEFDTFQARRVADSLCRDIAKVYHSAVHHLANQPTE